MIRCISGCMLAVALSIIIVAPAFAGAGESPVLTVNEESGTEYRTGLELFQQGLYADAIMHFEKAYEHDGRNINAIFATGLALDRTGRPEDAVAHYLQVLAADSTHAKAMKALPQSYFKQENWDKALAAYERGARFHPEDHAYPYGIALVHLKREAFDRAAPQLRKTLELRPDDTRIQFLLASCYVELGNMPEAVGIAHAILARDESHARARLILADHLRESANYDAALKEYKLAAGNIDTKAYAEHYIEIIEQLQEELEIEREYQERLERESLPQNR